MTRSLRRPNTIDAKLRRDVQRSAMSLLELIAVVTLMGIISAGVAARYGRDILGDVGVRNGARKLSLGMLEAQRCAIRTGDKHGLQLYGSTGDVSSWAVFREYPDGSREIIDGPFPVPEDYKLSAGSDQILFDFEGNGTNKFEASLDGPHRNWELRVFPLTRMIDCQEVSK